MGFIVHCLSVGKQKDAHFLAIENEFLKRISFEVNFIELKSHADSIEKEQEEIDQKIQSLNKKNHCEVLLLTENGTQYSSKEFANIIRSGQSTGKDIIFIIGGANGFTQDYKNKFSITCSLSLLTFPHRFARSILVEQLYRSQTIIQGHPYHN
jgi:23S rRNA (pseudouridine1915-N3)-methyltransferase